MRSRPSHLRISLLGAMLACTGCPGTLQDPARFETDAGFESGGEQQTDGGPDGGCPDVPNGIFQTSCATAICHSATVKQQGLDLASPNVASRLVGVCATEGPGMLIDPANPSQSVIYTKITAMPPFGARMPFGQTALGDATIACVLAWVSAQTGPEGSCAGDGGSDAGMPDSSSPSMDSGAANDGGGAG